MALIEDTPSLQGKEATRERILDAATEVFAQKGYHGAAVDDIVKASRTSKGAIYFHFPGKREIFFALVGRFASLLARSAGEAISQEERGVAKVDASLRAVFSIFSRHRKLAKILLVGGVGLGPAFDQELLALHARFAETIKGHLDAAVADGSIPPLDTEIAAYAWLGAVSEVITRWLYTGQPEPLGSVLPTLRSLLLGSIGARDRPLTVSQPALSEGEGNHEPILHPPGASEGEHAQHGRNSSRRSEAHIDG